MKLYDSKTTMNSIAAFEGNPKTDKDPTVFRSFAAAKKAAVDRIESEIAELTADLAKIKATTIDNIEVEKNPFIW